MLHRPKFAKYFEESGRTPQEAFDEYQQLAEIVSPIEVPKDVGRDTKDIPFLEDAVGGKVEYLISGDKDLLDLKQYQQIPIVTVAQFLEILTEQDES